MKTYVHTKICTSMSVAALFTIVKKLEETEVSFNRWVDKQTFVTPDNGLLFNNKKKWGIKSQKDTEEP